MRSAECHVDSGSLARFEFETLDSTNEAAKRLIREGRVQDRALIVAREQTAGKGTRGRTWVSPKDAGLYFSVVEVCKGERRNPATEYTLAAAVACAEVLRDLAGVTIQLKPINDLYADGRKLGGILVETTIESGAITSLITGVGINLRRAGRPLPPDSVLPVCLEELLPPEPFVRLDFDAMTTAIAEAVLRWNGVVARGDLEALQHTWNRHAENPETKGRAMNP